MVLCCVVLCAVVLCCVVLCCVVLCAVVLCVVVLCCVLLCCVLSCCVVLCCAVFLPDCLNIVRDARKRGLRAPVVFMGCVFLWFSAAADDCLICQIHFDLFCGCGRYVNPLMQYGEERAVRDAKEAGMRTRACVVAACLSAH